MFSPGWIRWPVDGEGRAGDMLGQAGQQLMARGCTTRRTAVRGQLVAEPGIAAVADAGDHHRRRQSPGG
jgi:hypothetical protein